MQSTTDGLVTFLPHSLPFICQQSGMTGTVLIQSPLTTGISTVQLEEAQSILEASNPTEVAETVSGTDLEISDEQLKIDKESIYKHPLFPLMTQLFERCEKATQGGPGSNTVSEGFDEDILAFVRQQEQNGLPFFIDNPDVDGLMVRAIQVLRIHVLEIEKVGELCQDFCQRYIASLKLKLNSEQLLGDIAEFSGLSDDDKSNDVQQQQTVAGLGQGQVVSGGTVYQMVQTPQGLVAQPIQIQQPLIQPVGHTTISQLVSPTTAKNLLSCSNFEDDDETSSKKLKRGVLPKRATQIMKSWLFQHIAHPYPTEDEKRQIATQTNLSMLQVNNWFINGRRRILQPMLDAAGASNVSDSKPKVNKNVSSTKSAQRFWPETIAGIPSTQPLLHTVDDSNSQNSLSIENAPETDEESDEPESSGLNSDSDDDDIDALQLKGPSLLTALTDKTVADTNRTTTE